MAPEYLASPVGAQIDLERVTPVTVVDTETPRLPTEGSCAIIVMTPNGRTGEEGGHVRVSGTTGEARLGGEEEAGPSLGHVVVTT